jgi:tetratricopeptide (TPR) repeat protein
MAILTISNACPATAETRTDQYIVAGYKSLAAGSYQAAAQYLSQAVSAEPTNIAARRYLAIALLEGGLAAPARKHIEIVIASGQAIALDYYYCAKAHYYCADYSRSISMYQYALQKNPKLQLATAGLAQAREAQRASEGHSTGDSTPTPDS